MTPATLSELRATIDGEGDYAAWESSGYGCFMKRTPLGNWCGYASVPPEHPWSGLVYTDPVTPLPERDVPETAIPIMSLFVAALKGDKVSDVCTQMDFTIVVHGGLTWSGQRRQIRDESDSDVRWTFGFDCAHAGDLVPGAATAFPNVFFPFPEIVYRDRDYVFAEASRLAAQLRLVQQRGHR